MKKCFNLVMVITMLFGLLAIGNIRLDTKAARLEDGNVVELGPLNPVGKWIYHDLEGYTGVYTFKADGNGTYKSQGDTKTYTGKFTWKYYEAESQLVLNIKLDSFDYNEVYDVDIIRDFYVLNHKDEDYEWFLVREEHADQYYDCRKKSQTALLEMPDSVYPDNRVIFSNRCGDPQTVCSHAECDALIAPYGMTWNCPEHSNKCQGCGDYINWDMTECITCLTKYYNRTEK